MQASNPSAKQHRRGHLKRAAEAVLQFFMRTLTPAYRPITTAHEVPPLSQDDHFMQGRKQSFSSELFAELLIELPMHRRRLARAHERGDAETHGNAVHQLLGAVAYCETPELEEALRELRLAIKTGEQHTIDVYHEQAINVLDCTLRDCGYRGHS